MPGGGNDGDHRLTLYRGVWCVYWREDTAQRRAPRRVSLRTTDRAEAERRLLNWLADRQRAVHMETVGQIVEAYIKDRELRQQHATRKTETPKVMRYAWRGAAATFDHLQRHHITRELCRDYAESCRREGLSPATVRNRLAILQGALRWQDANGAGIVELPASPPPRLRHLTHEEAGRLIEACGTPHMRLFVILALTTAARATALLELTWDRVDLDRGRIDLGQGAGNKRRARVPINETARTALVAAREQATADHVIEYAGGPVGSVKKGFAAACARAGIEGVSPHVLRHTSAVWMAEARVPMSEISQYLGHSSTAITERVYARYSPDYLRGAASALELPGAAPRAHLITGELNKQRARR
ncbi:tyrosine-type recombinase/integrase [Oceanibaculum nanhaiense]|uniref:tyrosine-type recombinase/integrase n=1 Tax=Oceanibaculum nanhaiense TaxID=1909734 RepID=UPI003D2C9EA6